MTGYQWTVASALYQLRWEQSERRESAVEYLKSVIFAGPGKETQDIALCLIDLTEDIVSDTDPFWLSINSQPVTCTACGGPLEISDQLGPSAGYLHVRDTDDTHVPQGRMRP